MKIMIKMKMRKGKEVWDEPCHRNQNHIVIILTTIFGGAFDPVNSLAVDTSSALFFDCSILAAFLLSAFFEAVRAAADCSLTPSTLPIMEFVFVFVFVFNILKKKKKDS